MDGPQHNHDSISALLKRTVVDSGAAPGAVAGVTAVGQGGWGQCLGWAGETGGGEVVGPHTLYDLASLTKPLVATVLARLIERGRLTWEQPLASVVPWAAGTASAHASLEQLASHRAGLDAHWVLAPAPGPAERVACLRHVADGRRADCPGPIPAPGFPPVYSDLGFILLGGALEAASGEDLDTLVQAEVITPLRLAVGSARQWRRQVGEAAFLARVAPTEVLGHRGGTVRGEVHDDNAFWIAGQATAGHAGLFGDLASVLGFARGLLRARAGETPEWLSAASVERLTRVRPGGSLRAGLDGVDARGSSAGELFYPNGFGHLGFTGTSFWCDPDRPRAVALLTNRVFPSRDNITLRAVRPEIHGALHRWGDCCGAGGAVPPLPAGTGSAP